MLHSKSLRQFALTSLSCAAIFAPTVMQVPAIAGAPLVKENTHNLTTATYLGGVGENRARAVGYAPNGNILAGGNFTNLQTTGATNKTLSGVNATAKGKLLQLAPDGKTVLAHITLGNRIDTLQVNAKQNRVVIGGDFGIVVLDATTLAPIWQNPLAGLAAGDGTEGQQTRVAINNAGQVAVLRSKAVTVFDSQGAKTASTVINQDYVNDIALGNQVYIVGFSNRKNGKPVQVPFLQSLDPNNQLKEKWQSWNYQPQTLNNDMADGRLYRVVIGGDGKLAVLGESAGGNSLFRSNGKDVTAKCLTKKAEYSLPANSKKCRLVGTDSHNTPYNTASNHIIYYAKLNSETGEVIAGQFTLGRLPNTKGNTVRAKDGSLAVDSSGNIHIGGISAYGIAERDSNKVAGQTVAPYAGSDMYLLTVSADLEQRIRWTPFAKNPKGGGTLNALAIDPKSGNVALFGSVEFGSMITTDGIAPTRFNPETGKVQDAYFAILKTK
jgi:hypothetical protein